MAELSGVEAAVFGPVPRAAVEGWLDRLASQRLGAGLAEVLFRAGRVSAVYGLRLWPVLVRASGRSAGGGPWTYASAAPAVGSIPDVQVPE